MKSIIFVTSLLLVTQVSFASSAKIDWQDFESISPSQGTNRNRLLGANTPMSFAVDTTCAASRLRTLTPGGVLNSVIELAARSAGKVEEQSVSVTLDSVVEFGTIEQAVTNEPCIHSAGYDGQVGIAQIRATADPARSRQAHLDYIRFDQGIALIEPVLMIRKPVVIAVIDAGTDLSHPDLSTGAWKNIDEVPGNGRDDDRNGFVDDVSGFNFPSNIGDPRPQLGGIEGNHGTHVAGLAAARWKNGVGGVGVGGIAKIMAVNVFGRNRTTRSSVVENAIRYAARNGAHIINLSLSGSEYSRTMASALSYAISQGAFVVSAAGNEGLRFQTSPDGIFFSPAAYGGGLRGMITVASVDLSSAGISRFSNYNPSIVQLGAPGAVSSFGEPVGLYSTFPNNSYGVLAGTSMAAPLVSGAAAVVMGYLKACGLSASPSRVEDILLSGSPVNPRLTSYINGGRELNMLTLAQRLRSIKCK